MVIENLHERICVFARNCGMSEEKDVILGIAREAADQFQTWQEMEEYLMRQMHRLPDEEWGRREAEERWNVVRHW